MHNSIYRKAKYLYYKYNVNNIKDVGRRICYSLLKPYNIILACNGRFPVPDEITWELTYDCNLKCKMCFQHNNAAVRELEINDVERVIKSIGKGCKKINLTGGEIFLRKDMFNILDTLEKNKIKVFIITNGTLLNEGRISLLLRYKNIIGMQFSIDGPREIHDKIRGAKGLFDLTCDAIKLIGHRIPLSIGCVILPENLDYLAEIVDIARDLQVQSIAYTFEYFNTVDELKAAETIFNDKKILNVELKEGYLYDTDSVVKKIKTLKRKAISCGIGVAILPQMAQTHLRDYLSRLPINHIKLTCGELLKGRIDPYGNVNFCQSIRKNFGNLNLKTFSEVWNSEDFIYFRKSIMSSIPSNPICRRCCKLIAI